MREEQIKGKAKGNYEERLERGTKEDTNKRLRDRRMMEMTRQRTDC